MKDSKNATFVSEGYCKPSDLKVLVIKALKIFSLTYLGKAKKGLLVIYLNITALEVSYRALKELRIKIKIVYMGVWTSLKVLKF